MRRLGGRFDVVNTHMTAADIGAAAALWFTRRSRRPVVVATRHFAKPRGRVGPVPIGRFVRRRLDAQIAISRAVADAVDGRSTVVHTGVENRPLRDVALRDRVVLIAQRLQPEKRTDVGIRAFAASGLADDGWTLEIAGAGPERGALEALATDLGIGASTRFLGYRTDLPQVMDRAGMLIAPCPVEGLGLTLLEAMAGGLPVVAAGAAGHLDVLAGLDSRAMFPPNDVGCGGPQPALARRRRARPNRTVARGAPASAATSSRCAHRPTATEAVYRGRTMTDLVVVSLEAWDDVWRRNQHLVAGLLRSDAALRVLFVEPPADPTHDLRSGAASVVRARGRERFRMSRPAGCSRCDR